MIEANEITLRIDQAKRKEIHARVAGHSCPTYRQCLKQLGESIKDHSRIYHDPDRFVNDVVGLIHDAFHLPGRPSIVPEFEYPELDS